MSRSCDLTGVKALRGNMVSHSNIKTKRRFLPNLQNVSLKSEALGVNLNLRLATKTLRTVNKYGSLDSFLVNYGYNKLNPKGRDLRKKVIKKLEDKKELNNVKIVVKRNRIEKQSKRSKKKAA